MKTKFKVELIKWVYGWSKMVVLVQRNSLKVECCQQPRVPMTTVLSVWLGVQIETDASIDNFPKQILHLRYAVIWIRLSKCGVKSVWYIPYFENKFHIITIDSALNTVQQTSIPFQYNDSLFRHLDFHCQYKLTDKPAYPYWLASLTERALEWPICDVILYSDVT